MCKYSPAYDQVTNESLRQDHVGTVVRTLDLLFNQFSFDIVKGLKTFLNSRHSRRSVFYSILLCYYACEEQSAKSTRLLDSETCNNQLELCVLFSW